jgi:hypothetical protein
MGNMLRFLGARIKRTIFFNNVTNHATRQVFQGNIERVSNPDAFAGKENELKQVIAQHLLRQGRFGIAQSFIEVFRLPSFN